MDRCGHCGEYRSIQAKGLCTRCYFRAYRRSKAVVVADISGNARTRALDHFFQLVFESALKKISRTENSDLPSKWAESVIRLPPASTAKRDGRIHWDISPDSIFVMDLLKDPAVHRITMAYSAQSGKSLILQAASSYLSQVRRDSIIYGLPSVAMLKAVPLTRFDSMFERSGFKTRKKNGVTIFEDKNTLQYVLLSSRDQLAEKTARVVIVDEIGELGEMDFNPVAELEERQRIFPDALTMEASTPKNPGKDILASYELSRQHDIEWPCPQCNEFFHTGLDDIRARAKTLDPKQAALPLEGEVRSDDGSTMAPTTIRENESGCIYCPHCGVEIGDEHHQAMVKLQRWRCLTPERSKAHMGFKKAVWNSPFKDFSAVLAKKVQSYGDPVLWQQFRANWCADPIDISVDAAASNSDAKRGDYLRGEPPANAIGWVFGADVGATEIWISCFAASPTGMHQFWSQRIDRDRNDIDSQLRGFRHLMNDRPWSGKLPFLGGAIDSGYDQKDVLDLVRKLPHCVAVKGDGSGATTGPYTVTKDSGIYLLNHAYWQDYFQSMVNAGTVEIPRDAHAWIETHWKNEVKKTVLDGRTNLPKQIWALRYSHAPNHLRDASIYALFLAHLKGLTNIRVVQSNRGAAQPTSTVAPRGSRPGISRVPVKGMQPMGRRERW